MIAPFRRFAAGAFLATLLSVGLLPMPAVPGRGPQRCGLTTLQGTIAFKDGRLSCAAPDTLTVREDLLKAKPGRQPTAMVAFAAMTDLHLADEESPLRGEFLDKCSQAPTKNAFRLNETLEPQLINSVVQAIDEVGAGPKTGRPFDFAVQLGDPADNQQWNEVRNFIDLLDGGAVVDPDSGKRGYEGVQGRDPYPSPVSGESLRDLANEPFYATGLRRPNGAPMPWYSVMGNHDRKVRGTVPNDSVMGHDGPWMTFAREWVTGMLRIDDLPPDQQQRLCDDPTLATDPSFWMEVAATPGAASLITADPNRRLVSPDQWAAEHLPPAQAKAADSDAIGSTGLPAGHGLASRCTGDDGTPLDRLCYSFDVPPVLPGEPGVHFISLDTSADEGIDTGNVSQAEWNWLNADLKAHSRCYYADDDTTDCTPTGAQDSVVVVFSHHSESTMTNIAPRIDREATYHGSDLSDLLLRFPNVVLHVDGHTHWDKVTTHTEPTTRPGGYWEVNIASVVDWPNQARTIEIADNHDGTMSIFSVGIDAAAPVDPHAMSWGADQTHETKMGAPAAPSVGGTTRDVNEDMLASIARWTAAQDPQNGAAWVATQTTVNQKADRNVELVLTHPTGGVPLPVHVQLPPNLGHQPFPFPLPFHFPTPQFHFPPNFQFPPRPPIFPPVPPPNVQYYQHTFKGLGRPAKTNRMPLRYPGYALGGAGMAAWLFRVRVRRNMVGL